MSAPRKADDEQTPEFARGGLVKSPDGGSDSVPVLLLAGEHWYTADQVRRFMAAKPCGREAFRDNGDG